MRCSGSVLLKSAFVLPPQLNTYRRSVLNIFTARGLVFQNVFSSFFPAHRGGESAPRAVDCFGAAYFFARPRRRSRSLATCAAFPSGSHAVFAAILPPHTRTHGHSSRIEMPVKKARSYFAGRRRREYYYIIDMGSESITSSISSSNSNSRFSSSTALTTAVTDGVK